MRPMIVRAAVLTTGLALGCNSAPEASESTSTEGVTTAPSVAAAPPQAVRGEVSARGSAEAAVDLPQIGGTLVAAGEHVVEVLPHADGEIEALVRTQAGASIAGEAGAKLSLGFEVGGSAHPVELRWEASRRIFLGSMKGGFQVTAVPVVVELELSGAKARGRADAVLVAPSARFGGRLLLAGDLAAEVSTSAGGRVQAALYDLRGVRVEGRSDVKAKVAIEGGFRELTLAWDPDLSLYVGTLEGAVLVPGAIELWAGASAHGRIAFVPVLPAPSFGGRIVVAGDYSVELVPVANGEVRAYVYDRAGMRVNTVTDMKLNLELGAGANAKPLHLKWEAAGRVFVGELDGGLDLATTPVVLVVATPKARYHGRLDVEGRIGAHGRLAADPPGLALGHAKKAKARAELDAKARAKAELDARAKLKVKAPEVRTQLEIKTPPPPSVKIGGSIGGSASAGAGAQGGATKETKAGASGGAGAGVKLGGSGGIRLGN